MKAADFIVQVFDALACTYLTRAEIGTK